MIVLFALLVVFFRLAEFSVGEFDAVVLAVIAAVTVFPLAVFAVFPVFAVTAVSAVAAFVARGLFVYVVQYESGDLSVDLPQRVDGFRDAALVVRAGAHDEYISVDLFG